MDRDRRNRVYGRGRGVRAGFTLIELLVVVSIIALLVSILLPSLAKARNMAKRAVCGSNLHQCGVVVQLYANDFKDELIPPFVEKTKLDLKNGPFVTILPFELRISVGDMLMNDYGMKAESWMCPAMEAQKGRNPLHPYLNEYGEFVVWEDNGTYPDGYWIGFANLMRLGNMTMGEPQNVRESAMKATDPGDRHIMADLNLKWNDGSSNVWEYRNSVAAHRTAKGGEPEGGTRLHLDGHAEWIGAGRMGYDDEPLSESEGKFDHAPAAGRDYYW